MKKNVALILVAFILINACNEKKQAKTASTVRADTVTNVSKPPQPQPSLKVAAYLIYEDESLSDFDVLNDKSIALWNTIIGAGDAVKPSNSTKLTISGGPDKLQLKITNGHKVVLDTNILNSPGKFDYVIKNTGCDEVLVNISRIGKVLFNDTIPFHCGE